MPSPKEQPVLFGKVASQRIMAAVKKVEGTPYKINQVMPNVVLFYGVVEAVVTNSITAFDSSTNAYGVGMAQIFIDDTDANSNTNGQAIVDQAFANDNGNTNATVTVLNWLTNSGTIAVNTHILIAQRNGNWRLITGDCP